MSRFVESLKRLFQAGKVTVEKLDEMLILDTISGEAYEYIMEGNE